MKIKYSDKAVKQFSRIHKGDRKISEMIILKIEQYAEHHHQSLDIKTLKGKYGDFKRLRVGNYRVIFEEQGEDMLIYEIKHRQEAYHD